MIPLPLPVATATLASGVREPALDQPRIGGRPLLPFVQDRQLLARPDRVDPPAQAGIAERGLEHLLGGGQALDLGRLAFLPTGLARP
jgi:hypothetical protein